MKSNWRRNLNIQKHSMQWLTKGEVLKLYNKYRTGHDYTNEAWDMKYKVLDICNHIFEAHAKMQRMETEQGRTRDKLYNKYKERNQEFIDEMHKVERKIDREWENFVNENRTTGREDSLRRLKYHAKSLENATDPFEILLALDKVFNVIHDRGPVFQMMLQRAYSMSDDSVQELLSIFDQVRDLGTK